MVIEGAPPAAETVGRLIRNSLLWPVRWGMQTLTLLLAERRIVDGFCIHDATGSDDPGETLGQLERSLALLAEIDPRRYRRLRRDLPRILVVSTGETDYYPPTRSGMIPARLVQSRPEATIAIQLVGLGSVARITNTLRGYPFRGARNQQALRRSVREQMSFASRLDPERFSGTEAMRHYLLDLYARYT